MTQVFCSLCKYYETNISWMGGNDFDFCKHPSNKDIEIDSYCRTVNYKKNTQELNANNDCKNYRFSIFNYFFN